jgi:hypothetical protein
MSCRPFLQWFNEIPPQSNFTLRRGTLVKLNDPDVLSHEVLLYWHYTIDKSHGQIFSMGSAPSPEANYPVVFCIFLPLLQASSRILPYIRPGSVHSSLLSIHHSPLTRTLDVSNNKYIINRQALLAQWGFYFIKSSSRSIAVSNNTRCCNFTFL